MCFVPTCYVKLSVGLFLPAVVRPMLDTYRTTEQPPQPALSDVSVSFGFNFLVLFWKQITSDRFLIFYLITGSSISFSTLLFSDVMFSERPLKRGFRGKLLWNQQSFCIIVYVCCLILQTIPYILFFPLISLETKHPIPSSAHNHKYNPFKPAISCKNSLSRKGFEMRLLVLTLPR